MRTGSENGFSKIYEENFEEKLTEYILQGIKLPRGVTII